MGLLLHSPGHTRVKICGLRTSADVDAAVLAGVDVVGLVVNATDEEFAAIRAAASITLWQFHGDDPPAMRSIG